MKKIICFAIIICFFTSCADDYYMEGRVKTIKVTNITNHSATLEGSVEITVIGNETEPTITSRGFVLKTLGRPDLRVVDNAGREGNFRCEVTYLLPNTTYSVQAFATIRYNYDYNRNRSSNPYDITSQVFYGNTIEFTTQAGDTVAPPDAQDYVVLQADGIMVQKNDISAGTTWSDAITLCQNSRVGGFNNWRLPTRGELESLYGNRISIGGFVTTTNTWYWTNTSNTAVNFNDGWVRTNLSNASSFRVRCVRSLP